MKGSRWIYALVFSISLVIIASACAPAPTPVPTSAPPTAAPAQPTAAGPSSITIVDTNSGANFQQYFKTVVVPQIQKQFNVQVNYVVSSGPEITQRLKAWQPGQGDIDLLWVKDFDMATLVQQKIPLEKLPTDLVPNLSKDPKSQLDAALGVPLNGTGALYWRSQMGLIYNSAKVPKPPTSAKEFYDRRAEWKGHIGWIRPDAKSAGGRYEFYAFLTANGVDFSQDFKTIQDTSAWKTGWDKVKDFQNYWYHPIASEPPVMFDQFKSEDVWLGVYSLDYSIWSRDQGNLPPTIQGSYFSDGTPAGSDMYMAVPAYIPDSHKPLAEKIVNFLLSDDQQIQMISTMWQYTGTDISDKVPAKVWQTIPKWEDISKVRIRMTNTDALDYISKHAMEFVPGG